MSIKIGMLFCFVLVTVNARHETLPGIGENEEQHLTVVVKTDVDCQVVTGCKVMYDGDTVGTVTDIFLELKEPDLKWIHMKLKPQLCIPLETRIFPEKDVFGDVHGLLLQFRGGADEHCAQDMDTLTATFKCK